MFVLFLGYVYDLFQCKEQICVIYFLAEKKKIKKRKLWKGFVKDLGGIGEFSLRTGTKQSWFCWGKRWSFGGRVFFLIKTTNVGNKVAELKNVRNLPGKSENTRFGQFLCIFFGLPHQNWTPNFFGTNQFQKRNKAKKKKYRSRVVQVYFKKVIFYTA